MKLKFVIAFGNAVARIFSLALNGVAFGSDYSRDELDAKSREELIDIILDLQGDADGSCSSFEPYANPTPRIMTKVQSGHSNSGSLRWPNGETFLVKSSYANNNSLVYPNGKVLLQKSSHADDDSVFWPNGSVLRVRSSYSSNGSIRRPDGSAWLIRSSHGDNRSRVGLPVDSLSVDGFSVRANLGVEDMVDASTTVRGDGWKIVVRVRAYSDWNVADRITVQECFR